MHLSPGRSSMSETAVTTQGVRLSRRRFLRLAIAVPSAGVIALQTACGGKRTAGGADAIVQTLNSEGDRTFDPGEVTVVRFNKVIWQNVSKNTVHTITCDPAKAKDPSAVSLPQGAQPFDSGELPPGEVFSYTFTVVGDYTYVSQPFEDAGMVGHVRVVA